MSAGDGISLPVIASALISPALGQFVFRVHVSVGLCMSSLEGPHSFDVCIACASFILVSGMEGRDLGLGSKIPDPASGVNHVGLLGEQWGLSLWRGKGLSNRRGHQGSRSTLREGLSF